MIFISGGAFTSARDFRAAASSEVIEKPFDAKGLARVVGRRIG
jgi:hypothetical protein